MMKSGSSTVKIKCTNGSSMHFSQSQCIQITNLEFIGCGGNQVKHVEEFMVNNTVFEGQENSGTALELIGTTAQIVNSTFVSNRKGSYRQFAAFDPPYHQTHDGFIGGAIIATNKASITISQSKFEDNRAEYGGAIFADNSIVNMNGNVSFINNAARDDGGVLYFNGSVITMINASIFNNNLVGDAGGVLSSFNSNLTIEASEFHNNTAEIGGVLKSINSTITIETSEFDSNSAVSWGGLLESQGCTIAIEGSKFRNNIARIDFGGVLSSDHGTLTIETSEFDVNSAATAGGVLFSEGSVITLGDCNFTNNRSPMGAIIYAKFDTKIHYHNYLLIDNNLADDYAVIYLDYSEFRGFNSGNFSFSNNFGSLLGIANSNITFSGHGEFVNNQPSQTTTGALHEGGAITLFLSNVYFNGECNLKYNHAENGGVIHSTDSKLYVNGQVTIAHNTATGNGGGIYLSTSELNCQQESTFVLHNNTAVSKGGGLHAISSSIKASSNLANLYPYACYSGTRINFTNNEAKFGGGLSLEANAKLNILRYDIIMIDDSTSDDYFTTLFIGNSADYGGAVYVHDDTNSGTCANNLKTECFFQVLALYDYNTNFLPQCMYFSQNSAKISGFTLYGGLLDRCALSPFAEMYKKYSPSSTIGGIGYFKNESFATNYSISSGPVRVCSCTNYSIHDCTKQNRVDVKKGEAFTVSLVAVDQVGQPVSATIQVYLSSAESGLA